MQVVDGENLEEVHEVWRDGGDRGEVKFGHISIFEGLLVTRFLFHIVRQRVVQRNDRFAICIKGSDRDV